MATTAYKPGTTTLPKLSNLEVSSSALRRGGDEYALNKWEAARAEALWCQKMDERGVLTEKTGMLAVGPNTTCKRIQKKQPY